MHLKETVKNENQVLKKPDILDNENNIENNTENNINNNTENDIENNIKNNTENNKINDFNNVTDKKTTDSKTSNSSDYALKMTVLKDKKNHSTLGLFGILFASFIAFVIICFFIFSFVNSKNTNIFSGIYIKNVDVSKLSKENAIETINTQIKFNLPQEIILKHNDFETVINVADLNINFDVESAVNLAYEIGRNSNFISNNFEILSVAFANKNIEPGIKIDRTALKNILADISSKLPDKMIESGYYIDDNNLIINKGQSGNAIDIDKMCNYIEQKIKNLDVKNKKLEIITKTANPTVLNIEEIYNEIHKAPVDATFTKEPLSITPSENGMDFNISLEEANALLNDENQEAVIPLKVVYPNVTTNMIGREAFPDVLSDFSTRYSTRDTNRTTNLVLASNKINGTVIMPGEVFSYNKVVGERTIATGYKEAPIYVSGRVEDGLGGGICQITTTLYNAVVYANLEIVERSNHQFVPSYADAGRDATVVYGAIDFKFKNNRNYPIKLISYVSGGVANFQILGLKTDSDYQVEISSKITSQTANSINSETYKILKQNGVVVDRILLSRDTYKRH